MTRRITNGGFLYFWVQISTFFILFLAANTGYQDFPRLSSYLANDSFLPRWLSRRGSRLVYSSGIIMLAVLASLLVLVFRANEIAMLPLYAIGVMLSFSFSQAGMFHLMGRIAHLKPGQTIKTMVTTIHYESNSAPKRLMNAVGATVTFLVFIILLTTKFKDGAWIVAILIPLVVVIFYSIRQHYKRVANALSTQNLKDEDLTDVANVVLVPIKDIHRGTLQALKYALRLSSDVRALVVVTSEEMKTRLLERWDRFPSITGKIKLVLIEYDFRDILTPLVEYIVEVNKTEFNEKITTVVVPEFISEDSMAGVLHNQTARTLHKQLRKYRDIVIINVPYLINSKI